MSPSNGPYGSIGASNNEVNKLIKSIESPDITNTRRSTNGTYSRNSVDYRRRRLSSIDDGSYASVMAKIHRK
jgi:hypothetical protein